MKRIVQNSIAFLLALFMLIQLGEAPIAWAAEEVDKKINPAEQSELTVPEKFQDGGNCLFIPETGYTISEKSPD